MPKNVAKCDIQSYSKNDFRVTKHYFLIYIYIYDLKIDRMHSLKDSQIGPDFLIFHHMLTTEIGRTLTEV